MTSSRVLPVSTFGAKGDGEADDTKALQAALDACHAAGGGVALVEPGVYLSGSLRLRGNVELRLAKGAEILGSTDLSAYQDFKAAGFKSEAAPESSSKCLLWAAGEANISVCGEGRVNGSGPRFYDKTALQWGFYKKPASERPRLVMMFDCENVKFENASFVDSPCWTFWLIRCRRVLLRNLKILGDQMMINNDGVDIDSCSDVVMKGCFVKTGDDCVILRAVKSVLDDERLAVCERVSVEDCVLDSRCQGVRVGCPSDGEIRDSSFSNIVFSGEGNALLVECPSRYLTPPGSEGSLRLHDVSFSNFEISCGGRAIGLEIEEGVKSCRVERLRFSGVKGRSGKALSLRAGSGNFLGDVVLEKFKIAVGESVPLVISNCESMKLDNVELSCESAR